MINLGDRVKNKRDGKLGIVVRIFESGSIGVLECVSPVVICTHDSTKTLEVIPDDGIDIFDETK